MGHILDLIITRSSDNIIKGTPSPDSFLSDHCSVWCCLNVTKVLATVKHISFRKLKSLDLVAFKNDIASSDLCNIASNDCNEVAELYDNCMRSILDRHAPMTSKRVFARPSAPWMSSNIIEAKRQRRKAERKWRSSKCQSDLAVFKRKRNHVTFLMNEARRVYYSTLIAENSHDQKHLFKVSKKLLNITGTLVLPPHEDKQKLANEMSMFFIKKIADIRLDLDNHDKQQAYTDRDSNDIEFDSLLFKFSSLSQEELRSARMESCIDDIRNWMLNDKLKLNDDKTESLIIGTAQQLAKVTISSLCVGNSAITPVSSARNVGSWFDAKLSVATHITRTCNSASYYLYNLRRIRKYLSKENTKTLVHAFISSRIDYCNSL